MTQGLTSTHKARSSLDKKDSDSVENRQRKPEILPFSCISLDLEVEKKSDRIHAFAAVRSDTGQSMVFQGGNLQDGLEELDDFADGASFLVGHNLIKFDLPRLIDAKPDLRLLELPMVDTLWLSPLAFPGNPYHSLIKHYKDPGLVRAQINNPELDARITLELLFDEWDTLRKTLPDLLTAWHWLGTAQDGMEGFDIFFSDVRSSSRPSDGDARAAILRLLKGNACDTLVADIMKGIPRYNWSLGYVLAWLSVAGGNSVIPPWVRQQFRETGRIVRQLRDNACTDSACGWCRERHDVCKELVRWFGFPDFRPEPSENGISMQRLIAETAMEGKHVLGIMPTGAGKSLCYQVPALSRYDKTGALTVVISPLVALMADQVAGLESKGIGSCVTVNGLLSMPERSEALERVRLGDASMFIVSPEGLRNRSIRRALDQREIGAWILDEAHCLSKWGHDFRPDYRYVGPFIRERAGDDQVPPVMCLTATAKLDVIEEIKSYFRDKLGVDLTVFNGGTHRPNLTFQVVPTTEAEKFSHVQQIIEHNLPAEMSGGAIVYCATRASAEEIGIFLREKALEADYFHAGLTPEAKLDVQQRFIGGDLRVISATNAFGMGIDKPDIRVVIHADMPGSLENYLQEAGRAGRDQKDAHCVMLYTQEDVERQFGMSARSRLTHEEIQGILRALRRLDRKKHPGGEVVVTAGEILIEDEDNEFRRDTATDDTRVRTAVSWLEESKLLSREENMIQVFPSSLYVNSVDEAEKKLRKKGVKPEYLPQLLSIVKEIINADKDQGISTDQLMHVSGLSPRGVISALRNLENSGIVNNEITLTTFVHSGVQYSSSERFSEAENLEVALIKHMHETRNDLKVGARFTLSLRSAAQKLREEGIENPLPQRLLSLLRSISYDGRGEGGDAGSLGVRSRDGDSIRITLRRKWSALEETAQRRRLTAKLLLGHLLGRVPKGTRGTDLKVDTTIGKLSREITSDIELRSRIKDPEKSMNRALLWLHEQRIVRLNRGLSLFRTAMTIRLEQERRGFTKDNFEPLSMHYEGQALQIHIMAEFARRGIESMSDALRMVIDYFSITKKDFLDRWVPGREKQRGLTRETTPESWHRIVEDLGNSDQQDIVADNRERTNVLVLAGPGSGKTRVLVHRIAYLLRVRRENPRSIMALAYNRHAAVEIHRRLRNLVGNDSSGVMVLTCHSLAMRLVGVSFSETARNLHEENDFFKKMLRQAVALLKGEGVPPEESDEYRERLLAGFRWILVDEYQDIGPDEYELISALAGRTLNEEQGKLTLFAVGDDDQNIYAFNGTSVEFIRRFEEDYKSRPAFLIENYRSTRNIIMAANAVIEPARERMKVNKPIQIDHKRSKDPPGGEWEKLDPVACGRVQILHAEDDNISQAWVVMMELKRLSGISPDWNWSKCAVIARRWEHLDPVRSFCEVHDIPVQVAKEKVLGFWHLRETKEFVKWLRGQETGVISSADLDKWLRGRTSGYWNDLLLQAVEEYSLETGSVETPVDYFIEWLAEWGREIRRRQRGLLLVTAHGAKGLEFDYVAVLGREWEDSDEERRLYYVAMTRARKILILTRGTKDHNFQDLLRDNPSVFFHDSRIKLPDESEYLRTVFRTLNLSEVFLSFAGYKNTRDPLHRAIAELSPGDQLKTRVVNERWELIDHSGVVVGQLAQKFQPPKGMHCRNATVFAVVSRSRDNSCPAYRSGMLCDEWEVVVPELVFEPK